MHRTFLALLGVAALAAAGCGGDDDKEQSNSAASDGETQTATTAAPLTKAQFIKQADDICRDTKKATQPFEDRIDALPKDAEIKELSPILEDGLPELRKSLERLRTLPAPADDRATLDEYLASTEKTLDVAEQLVEVTKTNDESAARRVVEDNDDLDEDQERLARRYGLKYCSLQD